MPETNDSKTNDSNKPTRIPGDEVTAAGGSLTGGFGLNDALLRKLRIRIPGYELLGIIGRGGQATVYKAIELTDSKMPVAIKILHSGPLADPAARERLRREARAMRALIDSPNIVSAFADGQTEDGHDYLVMNFIDGKPLDEFWKHRRPGTEPSDDSAEQLKLFKKICDSVALAHRRGITHRDLSPSNILVDEQGEPHILDFGLARTAFDQFSNPEMKSISVTGQFIGRLSYASPEQAGGVSTAIDVRTDVYALGIILYQILTGGRFPYQVVGTLLEVLNNIIHMTPVRPSEALEAGQVQELQNRRTLRKTHPARINRTLEEIVLKALQKKPEDRYQTAGELAAEIGRYLAGKPTLASLGSTLPQSNGPALSRPTIWSFRYAALLLAAAMITAGGIWAVKNRSPAQAMVRPAAAATSASAQPATKPIRQKPSDLLFLAELQQKMAKMPPAVVSGNWHVESNTLMRDEQPDLQYAHIEFGDPAWTDYDFKATVRFTEFAKTPVSLGAHFKDPDNFWTLATGWVDAPGALDLQAFATGESPLTNDSRRFLRNEFESVVGRPYQIELQLRGDKITALFDGQPRCTSQHANLTLGRVRLMAWRAARFDNITVTAPDGTLLWQGPPMIPGATTATTTSTPGAASAADPNSGLIELKSLGTKWVKIPAGTFIMGSPTERVSPKADETAHQVTLTKSFLMAQCPVTRAQFRKFIEATGYRTEAEQKGSALDVRVHADVPDLFWDNPGFEQTQDDPVVMVTWYDACEFCKWLSRVEKANYRLPTEAEAEYAYRPATLSPYMLIDDAPNFDDYVWYNGNSDGQTHPVGKKLANGYGLYDTCGNVFEWTQDWYDSYSEGPVTDPTGPEGGAKKVARGGCWNRMGIQCRTANRIQFPPDTASNIIGFRIVREIP